MGYYKNKWNFRQWDRKVRWWIKRKRVFRTPWIISFFFFFFSTIDLLNKLYKDYKSLLRFYANVIHPSNFPPLFSDQIAKKKKVSSFLVHPRSYWSQIISVFWILSFSVLGSFEFSIFRSPFWKSSDFFFFILWLIDYSCGRLLSLHLV